jgi:hypothetical protein
MLWFEVKINAINPAWSFFKNDEDEVMNHQFQH